MPLIHFKLALRHLVKNRFYTLINILGLAIGIAVSLIIFITVVHENSYDRFHKNLDHIYRLEAGEWALMPPGVGEILKDEFPEIKKSVRFSVYELRDALAVNEDKKIRIGKYILADSSLFSVFSFNLIQGNPEEALVTPFSVVLTESKARELFGKNDPVGKSFKLHNRYDVTVTGIIKDQPFSSIPFDAIGSFETLFSLTGKRDYGISEYWNFQTYFLLEDNTDVNSLSEKICSFMGNFPDFRENCPEYFLRPMEEIYFSNKIKYEGGSVHGNREMMYVFIAVAFFILVIAIINYVNLSTARSGLRARETGIRKITGASRSRLFLQFLSESILLVIFALLLALVIVEWTLPMFSRIINIDLDTSLLQDPRMILLVLTGIILTGILAGIYPALYISRFESLAAIRGELSTGRKGLLIRRTLIIAQFVIAVAMIFATQIIHRQVNYMKNKDLGFDRHNIVTVNLNSTLRKSTELFRQKLLSATSISDVSFANALPGSVSWQESFYINGEQKQFTYLPVDVNYLEFMGLELIEGRSFNASNKADLDSFYIFNETAIREFGFENAAGYVHNDKHGIKTIIGVVKDYHFNSLHAPVAPLALVWRPQVFSKAMIRINPEKTDEALKLIENVWTEINPDDLFEYHFLDDSFDQLYKNDQRFGQLFLYFSFIAIFIAGIGLFGMTTFLTLSRHKEISIRKVNGAEAGDIISLFMKQVLKWIFVANLFALPVTAYFMIRWLNNFPYRTTVDPDIFVYTFLITCLIAILTVLYHTMKALNVNPVEALKNE